MEEEGRVGKSIPSIVPAFGLARGNDATLPGWGRRQLKLHHAMLKESNCVGRE